MEEADQYAGRFILNLRKDVKRQFNVNTEFTEGIMAFEGDRDQEAKEWFEVQLEAENLNLFY